MYRKDIDEFIVKFEDIGYTRRSIERVLTGFHDLDYYIKGFESGLSILIADTNMGKSILTASFIRNAIGQGYNVGVFASEHSLESYKMLVMQQNPKSGEFYPVPFIDKNGNDTNIADWYVSEKSYASTSAIYDKKLVMYNTRKVDRDIGTIVQWMKRCYELYKTRFFIIDNFMEITQTAANQNQEQTDILTKLRDVALNNKEPLFVILVQHITKESVKDTFRLDVKSGSGTSNSGNKAYNLLALYRKDCIRVKKGNERELDKFKQDCAKCGFDYDACDSFLEVLKTKGNGNGVVGLRYLADNKTFEQAPKMSKTDADKIYKKYEKKVQTSALDWEEISEDEMPF